MRRLHLNRTIPLLFALLPMLLPGASSQAQALSEPPRAGSIRGTVIDASTMTGLGGTTVTLVPQDGAGALPPGAREVHFSGGRTTMTTEAGEYLFASLASGRYTMLVRRVGYEPVRLDVELADGDASRLSVGLLVHPIALQAIEVRADHQESSHPRSLARGDTAGRIAAALDRQQLFLATDARELTSADVRESLTLGSMDVLHALQRLPGVTHARDLAAPLWVRGNRWDHTRVYFDGVPLFHPLSGLAEYSGVGASAIGAAFLLPGVQPVSFGGGSAARIDLRSASGVADGRVHGDAGLSVHGGSAALGYRRADDRAGLHVTGRQGIVNLLQYNDDMEDLVGGFLDHYRYDEATVRGDVRTRWGRTEASGLYSHDDQFQNLVLGFDRSWESRAGRVMHDVPLGNVVASGTIGMTSFSSRSDENSFLTYPDGRVITYPTMAGVRHASAGVRLARATGDPTRRWQGGVDVVRVASDFRGLRAILLRTDSSTADTTWADSREHASVWGERRWQPSARLAVEAGFRMDIGGTGLRPVRPSTALQGRYTISDATAFSLGAGRTLQYVQQFPRSFASGSEVTRPWVVSGEAVPLLTIDQVVAGLERWHSSGVLLAGNVFSRMSHGIVMHDPRPGSLAGRSFFVSGRETVVGGEASARKLTGRVTGMIAYSYQHGRARAEGISFAAPAVRPHVLDATVMTRLGSWRLGAGAAFASGEALTMYRPSGWAIDSGSASGMVFRPGEAGAPGRRRNLAYSGFDVFADWSRQIRRAALTIHGGLRVVPPASGDEPYTPPYECNTGAIDGTDRRCWETPPFRRFVGLAPTLGLRVAF